PLSVPLLPYTTLFRSLLVGMAARVGAAGTPCPPRGQRRVARTRTVPVGQEDGRCDGPTPGPEVRARILRRVVARTRTARTRPERDRKSTRLNSSHVSI